MVDPSGLLISTHHLRTRDSEALLQSAREKVLTSPSQVSLSQFSLMTDRKQKKKKLESLSNLYRNFKRRIRYRRLPSSYSFKSLNN